MKIPKNKALTQKLDSVGRLNFLPEIRLSMPQPARAKIEANSICERVS